MALNTTNSLSIAFKKLSGKVHTQQNFAVTEEGISTNVQMSYATVYANKIEPLPVTNSGLTTLYSSNGIVQRVKFQIDIIPDTQIAVGRSQGYRLKLPADWNGNGDLFPEFSAGTYLHTALGKLQIVPSLYGTLKPDGSTEYDPILYQTNGSTVIAKFDPINWYFDNYSGILFIQDPPSGYDSSAARPGYLEAFLYVGDYLDDVIFDVTSGSTGTTGQNIGGGIGIFKDKIVTSGGTGVLRFKTLYSVGGIGISADTDNILFSFSGASALTTTASNGLTKVGQDIILGGELTGNTIIGVNENQLVLSGRNASTVVIENSADGDYVGQDYINRVVVEGYGLRLESYSGSTNASTLSINDLGFQFTGVNPTTGRRHRLTGNDGLISVDGVDNANNLRTSFRISATQAKFQDTRTGTTAVGIEYNSNYSANFTDRSLIDKGYLFSQLTGGSSLTANNGLTKIGGNIRLGGALTGHTTITSPSPFSLNLGSSSLPLQYSEHYYRGFFQSITTNDYNLFMPSTNTSGQIEIRSNNNTYLRTVRNPATYSTNGIDNRIGVDNGDATDGGAYIDRTTILNGSGVANGLTMWRWATGGVNVGMGISLRFAAGAASGGDLARRTSIDYVLTDVTDNAHESKYVFNTLVTGTSTPIAEIGKHGWKYNANYSANYTNRSLVDKEYVDNTVSASTTYVGDVITAVTYTATTEMSFIGVTGGSASTVWLPASPTPFKPYTVADIAGNAGTFNITVNGNGQLIQGSSTALIDTDYGSITFVFNTYNWSITAAI